MLFSDIFNQETETAIPPKRNMTVTGICQSVNVWYR